MSLIICLATVPANAVTLVPPGNRNVEQPPIPGYSARRTRASNATFAAKYDKIYHLLKSDTALRANIQEVSAAYDVAPIHIIGALVGEHTYNVDVYDHLQTYYVKAVSYFRSSFTFSYRGETVDEFLQRPEFSRCEDQKDSYDLWSCREAVWDQSFRGQSVSGKTYPADRFSAVFFQPFFSGQTFGIGQVNPLTALQMTDLVHRISGFEKIDHREPQGVYQAIMSPDITLAYVAATLRKSIDVYSRIAGFDISKNPGITATLYNLGNPETRAAKLAADNRLRQKQGRPLRLPQENYYGWLVNDKLEELEALVAGS